VNEENKQARKLEETNKTADITEDEARLERRLSVHAFVLHRFH
jgi:hypothetical protein